MSVIYALTGVMLIRPFYFLCIKNHAWYQSICRVWCNLFWFGVESVSVCVWLCGFMCVLFEVRHHYFYIVDIICISPGDFCLCVRSVFIRHLSLTCDLHFDLGVICARKVRNYCHLKNTFFSFVTAMTGIQKKFHRVYLYFLQSIKLFLYKLELFFIAWHTCISW